MAAQPQSAGVKVSLFLSNCCSNWEWVQSVSQFWKTCVTTWRLRWLPVGPHLRRGVYANTSRLALLQDPAAPRVYATLEIAGVCGIGHEWPVPPGGCETAPCFDQRAMSLERGSGLGQVLLGSSRGSNECFCISPRDPIHSALSDGPTYCGANGSGLFRAPVTM